MVEIAGYYDENAEASTSYDPIPAGDYRAKIIDSEIEPVSKKSDKGNCLKLTWKIETGPHDGRLIWQRLNMWAENMTNIDKVVSIANSQFASIREATGVKTPRDTSELHERPCIIKVAVQQSEGYAPSNEVKGVKAVSGAAPAANNSAPPSARAPAAGNGSSAPWRRNA